MNDIVDVNSSIDQLLKDMQDFHAIVNGPIGLYTTVTSGYIIPSLATVIDAVQYKTSVATNNANNILNSLNFNIRSILKTENYNYKVTNADSDIQLIISDIYSVESLTLNGLLENPTSYLLTSNTLVLYKNNMEFSIGDNISIKYYTLSSLLGNLSIPDMGNVQTNNAPINDNIKLSNFVFNETPSGAINGSNLTFYLAYSPKANSLELTLNGSILEPGINNDYTVTSNIITISYPPQLGDKLKSFYIK